MSTENNDEIIKPITIRLSNRRKSLKGISIREEIICSYCKNVINGRIRYRCLNCKNIEINLCEMCENYIGDMHYGGSHIMAKIRDH